MILDELEIIRRSHRIMYLGSGRRKAMINMFRDGIVIAEAWNAFKQKWEIVYRNDKEV